MCVLALNLLNSVFDRLAFYLITDILVTDKLTNLLFNFKLFIYCYFYFKITLVGI